MATDVRAALERHFQLITGPPGPRGNPCFVDYAEGPLVVDPTYGTAIIDTDVRATTPIPVAWSSGFTARRLGPEVVVLDPHGNVVAVTGRNYRIAGGYVAAGGSSGINWPDLPVGVFLACSFAVQQP
jgi:hypothetical protein